MPFVEPLAPTGYLSDGVFSAAGFCAYGENGKARSTRELLACERDACLRPLEINTTRERRTEPWPKDEIESCLHDLAVDTLPRYDALNAAFEEPVLTGRGEAFAAYRLYVFETQSFSHRMVRVVKTEAGIYVVVKGLEATEVPGQGRLNWRLARGLTERAWAELETLVTKANYWALPPRLRADVVQFDGKLYELEGVRGTAQHLVITPTLDGSLGKLVDYLLKLGDCGKSG
jgi:hypothetical protein